jgi:amino acid transporter
MLTQLKRWMIGKPIPSNREHHERLSVPVGIAVFASDALSSTAYATEEILLAFLGTFLAVHAGLLSIPVAFAIIALLILVVVSYQQVITTYPQGGGTYNVSKARLGTTAGLIAGAALLIDYILTAAVSITAGVYALTSTGLVNPDYKVALSILFIMVITWINLRGVTESGKAFTIPIYGFIASVYMLIAVGFWKVLTGQAPVAIAQAVSEASSMHWSSSIVVFGLLKAFSHGCAALTGIEAVSNGVTAFKEPCAINANKTLLILGFMLATMFGGLTYLAFAFKIMPDVNGHETVLSMLGRSVFDGESPLYFFFQLTTMAILFLGANTAFAGFPRLANILAQDGFLPRQLLNLGDRLVFSNGVLILSTLAIILIFIYEANPHHLIPLYAVGVFLAFTLSQASMVMFHWQERRPNWRKNLVINGLGVITTGVVTILLTVEKWSEGAYIVVVAIPIIVWLFSLVKAHYLEVGRQLALPEGGHCPIPIEHTVLVLVSSLNKGTVPALEYAKTISDRVEAVHVELSPEGTRRLRGAWDEWGCNVPLTILKSPYRAISEPLLDYIDEVEARYEHDLVTIIVPEFVTKHWWHNILHNQTSLLIKTLLRFKRGKVVTTVRYYLDA